jgi:twitching motility protein PilT
VQRLIQAAVDRGASVIHIKAGDVLRARIEGKIVKLSNQVFTEEETLSIALKLIASEKDRDRFDEIRDYDTSWGLKGVGRFRINISRQRGSVMVIMRVIPLTVPTLEELFLPSVLGDIAETDHGLVLVTGAVGTGKSTTQAAMIQWLNERHKKHIVTLEDPIEYLHSDDASTISQREVGVDTASFHSGLRAALRQDPDVILIGEMRDRATIGTALRAAELGQLVISTLPTPTATAAVNYVLAAFPEEEREMARIRLADTLKAVVAQRLLPRKEGDQQIPAVEILRVTGAIRDCILNLSSVEEITGLMETGREAYGMQTFQQHLQELVQSGMVDYEVAKSAAPSPSDFELAMQTLGGAAPEATRGDVSL